MVTFFRATMRWRGSISMTRSMRRKGERWGRRDMISRMSIVLGGLVEACADSGEMSVVRLLMAWLSINACGLGSAVAGAMEDAKVGAPWAYCVAILVGHDA